MTTPFTLPHTRTYGRLRPCCKRGNDRPEASGVKTRDGWTCGPCWIVRGRSLR